MTTELRPVRAEDCAQIAQFRMRMEGGRYLASIRDEAFYRHKYIDWGYALVLTDCDRVVGTIAATPKRIRVGDEAVPAADLGDLFIDPDFRGRGHFRRLHDGLVPLLDEHGIRMLTVRPGPGAQALLERSFGYTTLFRIREWVAALRPEGLRPLPGGRVPLVRALLPRVRGDATPESAGLVRPSKATASRFALPEPFGGDWPIAGTVRDAAWLRERYLLDPAPYDSQMIEVGGAIVAVAVSLAIPDSRGPTRGWIVDGWTSRCARSAAPALAAASVRRLRDEGADLVHFWSAVGPDREADPLVEALRDLGLRGVVRGARVLYRPVGAQPLPALAPPSGWMFRIGDTDGI